MSIASTAGTKLSVSIASPSNQTETDYKALTWTEVGEITDMGVIGADGNLITVQTIGNRLDRKLKGSINAGSQSLELNKDTSNAGQTILKEASRIGSATVDTNISFKTQYKDDTLDFYQALVMSYTTNLNDSNSVTGASCQVELNTSIVEGTV